MNEGQQSSTERNGGVRGNLGQGMDKYSGIGYGPIPLQTASLAAHLVEIWGAHAETPDGEDKAGRQKLRRLTTPELVQQACDTADSLFREFNRRNWINQDRA